MTILCSYRLCKQRNIIYVTCSFFPLSSSSWFSYSLSSPSSPFSFFALSSFFFIYVPLIWFPLFSTPLLNLIHFSRYINHLPFLLSLFNSFFFHQSFFFSVSFPISPLLHLAKKEKERKTRIHPTSLGQSFIQNRSWFASWARLFLSSRVYCHQ